MDTQKVPLMEYLFHSRHAGTTEEQTSGTGLRQTPCEQLPVPAASPGRHINSLWHLTEHMPGHSAYPGQGGCPGCPCHAFHLQGTMKARRDPTGGSPTTEEAGAAFCPTDSQPKRSPGWGFPMEDMTPAAMRTPGGCHTPKGVGNQPSLPPGLTWTTRPEAVLLKLPS